MINRNMIKDIDVFRKRCPDNTTSDLSLYVFPWSPLFPLAVHRFGAWINDNWPRSKAKLIVRVTFKFFYYIGRYLSVIFRKVEIDEDSKIDEGVFLSPKGCIIIGTQTMGSGCIIYHNVTIGHGFGSGQEMKRPNIGKSVCIKTNSIIYGGVKIGDGCIISSDTVVKKSIPCDSVVKGNPASAIAKNHLSPNDQNKISQKLC